MGVAHDVIIFVLQLFMGVVHDVIIYVLQLFMGVAHDVIIYVLSCMASRYCQKSIAVQY